MSQNYEKGLCIICIIYLKMQKGDYSIRLLEASEKWKTAPKTRGSKNMTQGHNIVHLKTEDETFLIGLAIVWTIPVYN